MKLMRKIEEHEEKRSLMVDDYILEKVSDEVKEII